MTHTVLVVPFVADVDGYYVSIDGVTVQDFDTRADAERAAADIRSNPAAASVILLRAAAQKVEDALRFLDRRTTNCGECHARHFVNPAHGRVLERHGELAGKLRSTAALITHDLQQQKETV